MSKKWKKPIEWPVMDGVDTSNVTEWKAQLPKDAIAKKLFAWAEKQGYTVEK